MRRIIVTLAVAAVATGISVVRTGLAHAVTPGSILASLIDPGGTHGDDFSISAVSIDGATAVVGADGTNFAQGAAYIYVKGSHGWPSSPTVTLQDSAQSNSDIFGNSVSVSGSTIVVGAYGTNSGQGAAYIYVKGPNGWPTKPTSPWPTRLPRQGRSTSLARPWRPRMETRSSWAPTRPIPGLARPTST